MTVEKYLDICEQMGTEPDPDNFPIGFGDLPEAAQIAVNIFHKLGDRAAAEIGYLGKDYSNLPILIDTYGVENKELLVDILQWLDYQAIKKSSEAMKREREKLKNKAAANGQKRSHPKIPSKR